MTIYSRNFKETDLVCNSWEVRTFENMLRAARDHAKETGEITYMVSNDIQCVAVYPTGEARICI